MKPIKLLVNVNNLSCSLGTLSAITSLLPFLVGQVLLITRTSDLLTQREITPFTLTSHQCAWSYFPSYQQDSLNKTWSCLSSCHQANQYAWIYPPLCLQNRCSDNKLILLSRGLVLELSSSHQQQILYITWSSLPSCQKVDQSLFANEK